MQLHTDSFLQGGKYKIEKVLGQGGFGITYLGTQVALNRKVAIKEFFMKEYCNRDEATSRVSVPSEGSKELVAKFKIKFIKEAQIIAKQSHPHIIRIHDIFEENGTAYYVMEYWNNGSLAEYVKSRGRLNETEALHYIRQIADALGYIHNHNMNHLDVKPGNILLDENKDAVLIDFGLSKQYDQEGNQTSTTPVGISHGYAPLEQYKKGGVGTFSPTTDIYSLGATLYKLLTGQTPPDANDVMDEGLPALPSFVSSSTALAIKKAMQTSRKDRPQSVKEFLALLDDEVTIFEPKVEPKKTPKATVTPTSNPFKKWIIPLAACVVVALAIIFWPKEKAIENVEIVAQQIPAKTDSIVTDSIFVEEVTSTPSLFYVTTSPSDATVYIDGKKVGTSPIENKEISRGTHTVKISKKGYETITEKLDFGDKPVVLNKTLTITYSSSGTINGHQYVDLGLSVKWADRNIGANKLSDYGNYYAWGEIQIKQEFTYNNSITYGEKFNDIANNILYDAALANWGKGWRLPTKAECEELVNKCVWVKTSIDGKIGYKITGPNQNSIFLPAAGSDNNQSEDAGAYGWYWSSTPYNVRDGNTEAYEIEFGNFHRVSIGARCSGHSIRPVSK